MQRLLSEQKGGRAALRSTTADAEQQALFMLAYLALAGASTVIGAVYMTGTSFDDVHSTWLAFAAIFGGYVAWRTASSRWRASLWTVMGLSRR